MFRLLLICVPLSLFAMTIIDRALGSRAEFLNAWSVVERLTGREPSVGPSFIATRLGSLGELIAVLLANAIIGAIIASLLWFAIRLFR